MIPEYRKYLFGSRYVNEAKVEINIGGRRGVPEKYE